MNKIQEFSQSCFDTYQSLDQQKKRLVIVGAFLLLFLLDFFLIMQSQLKSIKSLNEKTAELSNQLERFNNDKKRIGQLRQQLSDMNSKIKEMNLNIRHEEEVSMLLEELSRVANHYNVDIDEIRPLRGSKEVLIENETDTYASLSVMIEAQAGFHQLGQFLHHLENEKIFIDLREMDIEGRSKDTKKHDIKLVLKIVIAVDAGSIEEEA